MNELHNYLLIDQIQGPPIKNYFGVEVISKDKYLPT